MMGITRLPEGLDPSAASRVFGFRPATITTWLTRAGSYAYTLPPCMHTSSPISGSRLSNWMNCAGAVALALDPTTKILPVLELGPRTQHMAHLVLHSLRQILDTFRSSPA